MLRAVEAYARVADVHIVQRGFGRKPQGASYHDLNVMSHLSAFDIIEVYLIYNRSDSRKKRNALTSACRGCGYDSPFKAVHLLLKDTHKGEFVRTLIGTHFENLWILDATMFPEILDSANAMGRCNPS